MTACTQSCLSCIARNHATPVQRNVCRNCYQFYTFAKKRESILSDRARAIQKIVEETKEEAGGDPLAGTFAALQRLQTMQPVEELLEDLERDYIS